MRVLIGCECSGVVRRAFRALGHDAWSCDLQPADDGSEHHFQCDILDLLMGEQLVGMGVRHGTWELGIFHPECTYLTNSSVGRLRKTPPNPSPGKLYGEARWTAMREAAGFFRELLNCRIQRVAIENPVMHGHAMKIIGQPYKQTVQPYSFGDDASKRTCLWLKNLPLLTPTKYVEPRMVDGKPRWANQTDSGQNKLTPTADRSKLRAETYPGLAAAMAAQWGNIPKHLP